MTQLDEKRLEHLAQNYSDCRGEIEMRIQQRDNFSVQFIVAIGAVLSLALSDLSYAVYLLLLMPAITIFYTMQILYSYSIHDRIHLYLVNVLEPEMRKILGYSPTELDGQPFWETYSNRQAKKRKLKAPGIRKGFYVKACCVMPFLSSVLFVLFGMQKKVLPDDQWIWLIAGAFMVFYYAIVLWVLLRFKKSEAREDHGPIAPAANGETTNLAALSEVDYLNEKFQNPKSKQRAVFLDRDGTVNVDKVMAHRIEDLEYFKDTFTALKRLQDMGFVLVIVTNQQGIRDGVYSVETMHVFHQKMIGDLAEYGIDIAAVYFAPYGKNDESISFKPEPGMLMRARYELSIDMERSYLIGDQLSDIKAANRMRVKPIMVTTGIYAGKDHRSEEYNLISPLTASSLTEAVEMIAKMEK